MEAEVILEYSSVEMAKAVANAVSPDNFKTPKGLKVETTWEKSKVSTKIDCEKSFPTFIATIDDLLFCVSMAEKAVMTTRRLEKALDSAI